MVRNPDLEAVKAVIEFYHTLKNIYSFDVRLDAIVPALDDSASKSSLKGSTLP